MSHPDPASPPPELTQPSPASGAKKSSRKPGVLLLVLALSVGLASVGYAVYAAYLFRKIELIDVSERLRLGLTSITEMDASLQDSDGDLVADPPAANQLDPDVLVFNVLERPDQRGIWLQFVEHLKKVTGKDVQLEMERVGYPEFERKRFLAGGKKGKDGQADEPGIHIASLSTGTVPTMVNGAGFVPVCVMADKDGQFGYQMEILTRADSSIRTVKDLRDKNVGLTSLSSLSSFKLPLLVLSREGVAPQNFTAVIQASQLDALKRLSSGQGKGEKLDAVAVASDLKNRLFQDPVAKLNSEKFRVIYQSDKYPPACFGYSHKLKKELADKIKTAFLNYDWAQDAKLAQEWNQKAEAENKKIEVENKPIQAANDKIREENAPTQKKIDELLEELSTLAREGEDSQGNNPKPSPAYEAKERELAELQKKLKPLQPEKPTVPLRRPLLEAFRASGFAKFQAIDYKRDWAGVRKVDEEINQLLPTR